MLASVRSEQDDNEIFWRQALIISQHIGLLSSYITRLLTIWAMFCFNTWLYGKIKNNNWKNQNLKKKSTKIVQKSNFYNPIIPQMFEGIVDKWQRNNIYYIKEKENKHSAELQWTDPGTKVTGEFSIKGRTLPPNALNGFLWFPSF